jgi:HlyD family secretion protein
MTRKRKLIISASIAVLILGVAGIAIASNSDRGVEVRTDVVARRDLISVVTANGRIEPKRKVNISADIMGRVVQLAVEEGQWVERGALLLRIDPTTYQAQVRRAEAGLATARANEAQARATLLQTQQARRRAEQLAQSQDLISPVDLEQARTASQVAAAQHEASRYAVVQAEASLSEAREQLRKTTIVAPMEGRVTRLNIEEGEMAVVGTMNNPGSLLLTIADLSVMEARVKVDETDVPNISFGDSASVRIDAFPGETFTGRVTRIGNSAAQAAGAGAQGAGSSSVDFEVIVTLDAPPEGLRPDLSATADIVTATRPEALSIPILALTVRDTSAASTGTDTEGVFVVRDGSAEFVPVRVGIAGERHFEVLSGLSGGETVVAGTYQAIRDLRNGQTVRSRAPTPTPTDG